MAIKKEISYNTLNGTRIQLVKNDNKERYELYRNRKLEYYSDNIYWCKRQMAALIIYDLLGIIYDSSKEVSKYTTEGKKLMKELKISPA